ncbi:uncharacterized protein [Haliotis asinina]|uniref:uncharacterized protein n=1 Tax=Haliotis asinina TaxID=109174 RepID=UPI003532095A
MQESQAAQSPLQEIESAIDRYQERLDYLSTKRDRLEEELEHILETTQEALQRKKEDLLERLNDIFCSERDKLIQDIRDKEASVCETRYASNQIQKLTRSGSREDAENLEKELGRKTVQIGVPYDEEQPRLIDINLSVNFGELMTIVNNLPFGDVDAVYDDRGVSVMKRYLSSSSPDTPTDCCDEPFVGRTVQTRILPTKVEGDKTDPKLNDIAVVKVDSIFAIVVTDRSNKSVKSFYNREELSFFSRESTPTQPRGAAKVGNGRVGVTLPDSKIIRIYKVTPTLKRDKDIKTSKGYRGIGMLDSDTLAVSTYKIYPGTVDVLDFKGNILQSIEKDESGENLFDYPFYICTTPEKNIITSDCERKMITCLTRSGDIIFRYQGQSDVPLQYPMGVAMDMFGDILVVDCDDHKIVKIIDDGNGAKEYLVKSDGICGPYSIDTDENGVVYIAQWNGDVKIFNIG